MKTECNSETPQTQFEFQELGSREVVARFDGGAMTSDAGALLLNEVESLTEIMGKFAGTFKDYRDPDLIEFTVEQLLAQRVCGLALGYDDLNDHDKLRVDQLLATVVGRSDPTGQDRKLDRDKGKPLAGKSTLNRLELTEEMEETQKMYHETGHASRVFKDFAYRTLKSWSQERRVIGKAEYLSKGRHPRFVVTSISKEQMDAQTLYEKEYCARGDMENRSFAPRKPLCVALQRNGSKSSSWICLPIAPAPMRCTRTSYACGFRR